MGLLDTQEGLVGVLAVMKKFDVQSFEMGELKVAFNSAVPVGAVMPEGEVESDTFAEDAARDLSEYLGSEG